jgi:hypothetical protein
MGTTTTKPTVNLAVSALEAAPAVASGLVQIAGAVETSVAEHQTIAQTAQTALTALQTTLTSPAITGVIGSSDAQHVAEGVSLATEAEGLGGAIASLISGIEAFFSKL